MMKKTFFAGLFIAAIAFPATSALAVGSGGFENAVFSAKQLGAGATGTASPDEPAAISYNPAGIADLPGIQIQANANFESMFTWKKNDQTGSTRSSGTLALVPTGYLTINPGKIFCDKLAFGIGMDSPFGLSNKYDSTDAAVHYTGWKNWLKMYTLKPTIAYKVTDKLSLGGGPMWYRIYDFGGIQAYPNTLVAPGAPDGQIRLNLSGQHWGWQMGALYKITPKHRLGYYFRSPVVVKVSGLSKVENSLTTGTNRNFETDLHSKISTPMNMTWAYAYQPTEKTHYDVDFGYTHWTTNRRLYLPAGPTGNAGDDAILKAIGVADKDYSNGFALNFGATHKFTKRFTGRAGTYYFWTPVPTEHFTPGVPDSNRLTFSIGASYDISKYLTADLAYYNMIFLRRRVSNDVGGGLGSVDGTYMSDLQGFTISLTAHWDDLFPRAFGNQGSGTESQAPSILMNPAAK